MRLPVALLTMGLLNAAFAGCLFDADDAGEEEDDGDDALPIPPIALLVVSIDGNVTEAVNGSISAAVGVNLTFDGSGATGSNLTFGWDFGDGTTVGVVPAAAPSDEPANTTGNATGLGALPLPGFQANSTANESEPAPAPADSIVVHSFASVGNFTVTLYVTDEANQTDMASTLVVVTAGGPAPGTWLREDAQAFGNAAGATALISGCAATLSKEWVLVDVEPNGTASSVSKVVVTMAAMTSTGANGYTKLAFKDPAGKVLKEATTGTAAKTLTVDGPLAAGKYKVEAAVCTGAASFSTNSPAVAGQATYVAA